MAEIASLTVEVTSRGVSDARRELDALARSAGIAESGAGSLFSVMTKGVTAGTLAADAIKMVARQMLELGKTAITTAAQFERQRLTWGVLTGDMEKGKAVFAELLNFANRTPLSFQAVESAAMTMKGFGTATQDLIPWISRLGDLALGDSEKLQRLALVFGQVTGQQKALSQDLYQFVNAGVPIFQLLAEYLGEDVAVMKDFAAQGKLTFDVVAGAIKKATDEGGKYHDLMKVVGESTSGRWTTAMDNFKTVLGNIGNNAIPAINKGLERMNRLMESFIRKDAIASYNKILTEASGALMDLPANLGQTTGMAFVQGSGLKQVPIKGTSVEEYFAGKPQETLKVSQYYNAITQLNSLYQSIIDDLYTSEGEKAEAKRVIEWINAQKSKYAHVFSALGLGKLEPSAGGGKKDPWTDAFEQITGQTSLGGYKTSLEGQLAGRLSLADEMKSPRYAVYERMASELTATLTKMSDAGILGPEGKKILEPLLQRWTDAAMALRSLADMSGESWHSEWGGSGLQPDFYYGPMKGTLNNDGFGKRPNQLGKIQKKLAGGGGVLDMMDMDDETRNALSMAKEMKLVLIGLGEALDRAGRTAFVNTFKSIGEAMVNGEKGAKDFQSAMIALGQTMLDQLPILLLEAGLKQMLSGDYAGGIALIAASGFSAVGSGIFSAATSKHALGDVFGEMGNIGPKKFAYGGGVGMMDEAGPEAIIPLARMRNGALGVQARAGGSATIVNVIDQSSAKTVKETTETRGPSGEKIIQILIRDAVKGMIAEGKLDSSLASRYGVAAIGNTRRT